MNKTPRYMKWKVEKGRWKRKALFLTAAIIFSGGLAHAQVKVGGNIFGGGAHANVVGTDTVWIHGSMQDTIIGNVYGGGEYGSVDTLDATTGGHSFVIISNSQLKGDVYGGCEMGSVTKNAHVIINGGQIGLEQAGQAEVVGGSVFGGGLGVPGGRESLNFGNVDSTKVTITGGYIVNSVFGGGNNGHVLRSTVVNMTGGTVGRKNTLAEFLTDSLDHMKTHIYTGSILAGGRGTDTLATGGYNDTTGRVFGNAHVTVSGGVVRHAVYGGGGLSSVGTYETDNAGNITGFLRDDDGNVTGNTYVTIKGKAIIGPKKEDLVDPPAAELTAYNIDSAQYVHDAFKYLGGNEGWVFGAGCGLAGTEYHNMTFNDSTFVFITDTAQVIGAVFGGGENGHVLSNTTVNINRGIIGGLPLHGDNYTVDTGLYAGVTVHLNVNENELYEDELSNGHHVFRGEVYGGGKGTDTITGGVYSPTSGRVFGNTHVNISGSPLIYNKVYGGGSIASVGQYAYYPEADSVELLSGGTTYVNISGGIIGSTNAAHTSDGHNNGDVFGGGRGLVAAPGGQTILLAYVGNTNVTIDGNAKIESSVYGGGASGHVKQNTHVIVNNGTIGTPGLGGWHSNVYGGGGGTMRYITSQNKKHLSITAGRVFGNTHVEIKGGHVLHNVYGGGSIASVGTYDIRPGAPSPYISGGLARVDILGGTIGTDGNNNGMVFGSARGEIDTIGAFLDSLSYVTYAIVNIGSDTATQNVYPKVNGSVYGSGENGHVFRTATVNVYSGTIGCSADEYATYSTDPTTYASQLDKFAYRGNVYGAGCGTDHMPNGMYNPLSGIVQGQTEVNIRGGYISHNVYGGGAMASVGYFTTTLRHGDPNNTSVGDTLSWPCVLNFVQGTGKSVVNVYGGHIGTAALADNPLASGCVFGASRGEAGDRYQYANLANVDTTYVNINFKPYSTTFSDTTANVIVGCVFGGGDSGHVYDTTSVTVTNGLIAGSVFGSGDGIDMYKDLLWDPTTQQPNADSTEVYSITAGKVYGNTSVTITGGHILTNVYGGGNLASVGKTNYIVYGEDGNIANTESSGRTHVRIYGGTIGTDGINNGHVFGGSKGLVHTSINLEQRYLYNRDYFMGYANQTFVTIGENINATPDDDSPRIFGSVFGGGQDGHVRLNTEVTIKDAEIGVQYSGDGSDIASDTWKYRGNVYGAGRGITLYDANGNGTADTYCSSAGSVTRNTHVTVNGGLIHRDVYGGGSLATVGPPPKPVYQAYDPSLTTVDILGGTIGDSTGVSKMYGGNVYGSSRGEISSPTHPSLNTMASVKEAVVNIGKKTVSGGNTTLTGDALVNGSVYGSGENGHVNTNAIVNIYSGNVGNPDNETAVITEYCGNVFGAGSGTDLYDSDNDNTPDAYNPIAGIVKGNTNINIEGGWVMRSVYGGGEMASVGTISNDTTLAQYKHTDPTSTFALSWPYEFIYAANTGKATINVTGGRIGITGKDGPTDDVEKDNGDIYGGGKGVAGPAHIMAHLATVDTTVININYATLNVDPTNYKADASLNAEHGCIAGSVYGGGENGHVNNNTDITFTKGLIGHAIYGGGKGKGKYKPAGSNEMIYNLTAGKVYGTTNILMNAANNTDAYLVRSVFGGGNLGSVGKGNYAGYGEIDDNTSGTAWADTANHSGHTYVTILGGTLGMLPTDPTKPEKVIKDNIAYGSVFGGCRGMAVEGDDDRLGYVNNTHVVIGTQGSNNGPRLYGSVYGGAQDGHVRWNTDVVINSGEIGVVYNPATALSTVGHIKSDTLYWTARGNVFGGGSGLGTYDKYVPTSTPGEYDTIPTYNLIAGSVTGNTQVTINGGLIHRDVYGGGNIASVGRTTTNNETSHCWVDVLGGHLGDSTSVANLYGGNVYGSSRGEIAAWGALQDMLASVVVTQVNIGKKTGSTLSGNAIVNGSVYGSGENGHVDTDAVVNIYGGHVGDNTNRTAITTEYCGNVFGSGNGTDTIAGGLYNPLAGVVKGNTTVNIEGGFVMRDVYGGGEMASVGTMTDTVRHDADHPFLYSWPYKITYAPNTGKATVNVTGGRIGITGKDPKDEEGELDNGDVYGGSKGGVGDRYQMALLANVDTTYVNINYLVNEVTPQNYKDTTAANGNKGCVTGAVYGGGENGHVNHDTYVHVTKGLVGHAVYGGGKGKDTYLTRVYNNTTHEYDTIERYVANAGKVYGNTHITIDAANNTDVYVVRSVFGGGNLASVGVGNYAGGVGDYNISTGYGELVDDATYWADTTNTGHTYVNITGGTLGMLNASKPNKVFKDNIPYGSVFGGCRGMAVRDVLPTEVADLFGNRPDAFTGFVNHTHVVIGTNGSNDGPRLYGSVYGGAQDGHVRWNANVTINSGEIGVAPSETAAMGSDNLDTIYWTARGNVFGAGSGIGTYDTIVFNAQTNKNDTVQRYSSLAGSVTQKTHVIINGGTIHRNVYGGGDLATVGPPRFGDSDCSSDLTYALVDINAPIGDSESTYGGHVYGGSRGRTNPDADNVQQFKKFGLVSYTVVNINDGADIPNAVFGGGENGQLGLDSPDVELIHDATVNIYGGNVRHTVYGGGEGVFGNEGYLNDTISGFIMGSSNVNLLGGTVNNVYGGSRNAVIGDKAIVNVGLADMGEYTGTTFNGNVYGANNHNGTPLGDVFVNIYKTAHTTANTYPTLPAGQTWDIDNLQANADTMQYAINEVFGGGNQSDYTPGANLRSYNSTTVHVYNCDNTICDLYGGSNASNIGTEDVHADANIVVEGGRIHRVFGGGKGDNSANPVVSANIYGATHTDIQGGLIDMVFGGGNQSGSILETNLVIEDASNCEMLIDSIFGGSNEAPINGTVITTIACSGDSYENLYGGANMAQITGDVILNVKGSTITNVFGGSKGRAPLTNGPDDPGYAANIDGNVTLNLYGGIIENAFGGSDEYGNITGVVTVNVLDTVTDCPLDLTNVYGGSKTATLTANNEVITSPVVNIVHGTVKGNVFGGGLGTTATTTSNPQVNIGYDEATMTNSSLVAAIASLPSGFVLADTVKGNVYGGGALANVDGNPTVNVNKGVVGNISYGFKTNSAHTVYDTIIHAPNSGSVFGGGKGRADNISTDYLIAKVNGNTQVNINGGKVLYSVYGGGELASVRDSARVSVFGGEVGLAPVVIKSQLNPSNDSINIPIALSGTDGYVFGGGKGVGEDPISLLNPYGQYILYADVNNTLVTVNIPAEADTTTNRIWGSIFGGAEDGHVLGNANVRYISGVMGTKGTTSYDGNIFGGGRNFSKQNYTAGRVAGNIKVEMLGGQLFGSIFGGGRLALTGIDEIGQIKPGDFGNVKVILKGGKVGNQNLIEHWTATSMGDVFGGGKGSMEGLAGHDPASALLLSIVKNTEIIIQDSIVQDTVFSSPIIYGSVFGGGEVSNVGSYGWYVSEEGEISNITPTAGTGLAKITVSGGRIGLDKMRMSYDLSENTDVGHVFGGSEGQVVNPALSPSVDGGLYKLVDLMATVLSTEVTIKDSAWVKGSVYGGAMNGHVWFNSLVKVQGGQIGSGDMAVERKYTETEFLTADSLTECPHWPYGITDNQGHVHYNPHDIVDVKNGILPSDGHTWFGNVFGGGSGYYPYFVTSSTGADSAVWDRNSGIIRGSSRVEISGGHILTNVYGGCETNDVLGDSAVVIMTGGTVGVPRKLSQILDHPVTCYIFGAGKGDPRTIFNTFTNVNNVRVDVSGGWVYGSVFGGGEEGHVINNVKVNISGTKGTNAQAIAGTATKIGTLGYSYVDGNVFGAGRGFTSEALTAGTVKGNVTVNIKGGEMLGSVYGGGRLASVGYDFVNPTLANGDPNPAYGQLLDGDGHGYITVNISGGTIGNDYEAIYHTNFKKHSVGGNVFGGSMGRLTKLDGSYTDIWAFLAKAKQTKVNITGGTIKSNVYGGSEFGSVRDSATVVINGGEIWRDVYGGGYGSDSTAVVTSFIPSSSITASPMEIAGRVYGNTLIKVKGGWVKKSVYGGGELASVGTIDSVHVHEAPHPYSISWPYYFRYADNTGTSNIQVTGGRVGITGKDYMGPWIYGGSQGDSLIAVNTQGVQLTPQQIEDAREDNGDLYGAGKGKAFDRYTEAFCNNVNEAVVTINYQDNSATPDNYKDLDKQCIAGAVYGGAENGHVNHNTHVSLDNGLVGHAVYGGGKGKGKYQTQLLNVSDNSTYDTTIYSVTAGKVYGNTYITINGGNVVRSVFGGGNLASVGIGNYAGDDYNPGGYGEPQAAAAYSNDTLNSGHTYVYVNGGTLGTLNKSGKPDKVFKDGIAYGSVFGGCRGIATPDVDPAEIPHLFECRPDVFYGYVNHTHVRIGENVSSEGPRIYGSVYGGAQDGHIRYNANTVINSGTIGVDFGGSEANYVCSGNNPDTVYWVARGNVFGGGSGNNTYETYVPNASDPTKLDTIQNHSSVAGSITQNANVIVNGGTIYHNVYGGGDMATVGPPRLTQPNDSPIDSTCVTVNINGGSIGENTTPGYGGYVYGGSRGLACTDELYDSLNYQPYHNFALVPYTVVNINSVDLKNSVFGGGENGQVGVAGGDLTHTTTVNINGTSQIGSSTAQAHVFGGGKGIWGETGYAKDTISGRVMGSATVNINGSSVVSGNVYGGGELGVTHGPTTVNINGGTVNNHVFGGAYGQKDQVHVLGLRMVNMRRGLVGGNVYGGSFKANDALTFHPSDTSARIASVVNYSGGTTNKHVFGAGDMGVTYGSTYVFVGTNAIMNAPHHTATASGTYNQTFYDDHGDLVITYDVWAGADFSDPNGSGTFDVNTVTGRSDIYIDGYGYDTRNGTSTGNDDLMVLRRSVFGCGTLNDGGAQGKMIMIRNYGYDISNAGTDDPEAYINSTRVLQSIQYADSLIVENSHIRLQGRGMVNYSVATEEYAIYNIFDDVRVINGSSLFVDKPVNHIGNLHSNLSSNLVGMAYPATPVYTEVNYDGLTTEATDNKIRINRGGYLTVSFTIEDPNGGSAYTEYGALRGFFHLMTDGVYNAFAYARPKQSVDDHNIINSTIVAEGHNYPTDGGFVSYRPELNIYNIYGGSEHGGEYGDHSGPYIQMPYENHTPNQRARDPYFRVWRFRESGASVLDVVLHAIAQPNSNGFTAYTATLTLPPSSGTGSYYRFKGADVAEINYGSEIMMVNAGLQNIGSNWMYYNPSDVNADDNGFVYNRPVDYAALGDDQDYMVLHPNNVFGLTAIPNGSLSGGDPVLICNAANNGLVATEWSTASSGAPQITFLLTHADNVNGNHSWDPLAISFEQVLGETVTDEVTVNVQIVTSTLITQDNDVKTYALMTHAPGTGDTNAIYKAKVLLPAYDVYGDNKESTWTLLKVEWKPNGDAPLLPNEAPFDDNTFVSDEPHTHNPSKSFVGMTMYTSKNVDDVDGWYRPYITSSNPINLANYKNSGDISIDLGVTRGENPISFDFDLHYDGDQNVGEPGNCEMGVVELTVKFDNYGTTTGVTDTVKFVVHVLRRGKGKGFYIDGVNGQFNYSGKYPDAAQPSLAGILHFAENYEPVDSIYIVNKVTANAVGNLNWSTPYDQIRIFRYNGGHPLHQDVVPDDDKYFHDYLTTYVGPNGEINPAYKGVLVDVLTSMSIRSAIVDGAYELNELEGRPVAGQLGTMVTGGEHVLSNAPMFTLRPNATLVINGLNTHPMSLRNNFNQVSNGGAAFLEDGAVLKMNKISNIDNNYVMDSNDGKAVHYGGGVYLEENAMLLVSDSVMVVTNKHITATDTIIENVYLNNYNTLIQVGTSDGKDTYAELNPGSRIGVTKTAWRDNVDYMPVVFTEYIPHGDNLHTNGSYAEGQIVFDQQMRYGLYEYPGKTPNNDPNYDRKLYWVKTWVDYVTSNPDYPAAFDPNNIDTPDKLAWAISVANGYNNQHAAPSTNFTLTNDIDMSAHFWSPIGIASDADTAVYSGTFDGNGYVVTGLSSPFAPVDKGMFGTTSGNIKNLQVMADFFKGTQVEYLGGIVGHMKGGILSNCESAGSLHAGDSTVFVGGLVGLADAGSKIHSCFATDTLYSVANTEGMGGLVGHNMGNLYNSYSNFVVDEESWQNYGTPIGGLACVNSGRIENCYSHLRGTVPTNNFGWLTYNNNTSTATVKYCYIPEGATPYSYGGNSSAVTYHGTYGDVLGRKDIGYMYNDNKVTVAEGVVDHPYVADTIYYRSSFVSSDTARIFKWSGMLSSLNLWVKDNNANPSALGLTEVAPWFRPTTGFINGDLPVLGFVKDSTMATLDANDAFLHYSAELDTLLNVYNKKNANASIFLYGNATEVDSVPNDLVKVFVNEDAVLMQSNTVGIQDFNNTTVGITFDNSCRQVKTSNDIYGEVTLEYDWHLMSTPLSNASLGISYDESLPNFYNSPVDVNGVSGGYLPDNLPYDLHVKPRWDIYTYYEPEFHWVNLKLKSANHYWYYYPHSNFEYWGDWTSDVAGNETRFVPAKGYMMGVEYDSYLSNTGTLNKGQVQIPITALAWDDVSTMPSFNKGSNLVGNPYQAYLDLDKVIESTGTKGPVLKDFYIFDADQRVYAPYTKETSKNPRIPSQYIHPHQGFFVLYKPTSNDPDTVWLTFDPSMAGTKKDTEFSYFRGKLNYPVVNIIAENEIGERDLAVVELGRPELGGVEKAENMQNSSFKLYTRMEDKNYGLLFTPVGTPRIPLFFKTPTDGKYTLTWDTHNGTYSRLLLVDNIAGVQYDMLTHDHYDFEALATDYAARFYILFSVANTIEIDDESDGNFAYFDGTNWVIDGSGQLELLDVTGRVLYTNYLSGDRSRVSLNDYAAGTYLLRLVKGKQNEKVQKIVIY